MDGNFCEYDCCGSIEPWPEYIKKSAFFKKENLGIVRVGLPHAKEEFLKDIRNGTSQLFMESFLRSYFRPWEAMKSKKFKENNSDQSARYFFDPELGLVFVVALLGFRYHEEFIDGKVIRYKWLLKTVYYDSNLLKIKKFKINNINGD